MSLVACQTNLGSGEGLMIPAIHYPVDNLPLGGLFPFCVSCWRLLKYERMTSEGEKENVCDEEKKMVR